MRKGQTTEDQEEVWERRPWFRHGSCDVDLSPKPNMQMSRFRSRPRESRSQQGCPELYMTLMDRPKRGADMCSRVSRLLS